MSEISEKISLMYDSEEEEDIAKELNDIENPFGKRKDVVERRQREIKACEDDARNGILSIPKYIGNLRDLVERGIESGYVNRASFLANTVSYSEELRGGLTPSKPIY